MNNDFLDKFINMLMDTGSRDGLINDLQNYIILQEVSKKFDDHPIIQEIVMEIMKICFKYHIDPKYGFTMVGDVLLLFNNITEQYSKEEIEKSFIDFEQEVGD